jgi:hypothetical protein
MRTSQNTLETISTIGIDVGKNTFHLVGLDKRGVIVLQQKVTRHQLARRLSNIPRCLIGTETCSPFYRVPGYGVGSRGTCDPPVALDRAGIEASAPQHGAQAPFIED